MKRETARYVVECDTYRRVKANHLRPTGNLQTLSFPEWKWEDICMDFIMGPPCTSCGYHSMGHCGSFDQVSPIHTRMHLV
jgi:hypothetical protein